MLSDARIIGADPHGFSVVNEADGSLVLAGGLIPMDTLRLMHAHTNDLVDGAETAANSTIEHAREAKDKPLVSWSAKCRS